ncbi:LysR substrate-binding domain-containing protein [Bradyrhizobium sp. WSM2793]|uniref:LysR substrate-binding domain-containing protein n=1 Tax=Bradyrhizobium sp. WSM2793 TaxID=1038866 RepID=UPI000476CD50|nr:LysR substrate-binding domain-containing protein [Bradyrhizobium sp. WSM2793]
MLTVATAKSVETSEIGRLAIGFCASLSAGNLKASCSDIKQKFPRTDLATVEGSQTRLATALRNGRLDILIVTWRLPLLDCRTMPLWSERVLVALPKTIA